MRKSTQCTSTLSILQGKVCPRCHQWKDFLTCFSPSIGSRDGVFTHCDQCRAEKHSSNIRDGNKRRRQRQRDNGGAFTKLEFFQLCCEHNWRCLCCNRQFAILCADHVVSVLDGGTSYINNIQPMCWACNNKKRGKSVDYRPDADTRIIEAEITDNYIAETAARESVISAEALDLWQRIQVGETVNSITKANPNLSRGTVYLRIRRVNTVIAIARRIIDKTVEEYNGPDEIQSNFATGGRRYQLLFQK